MGYELTKRQLEVVRLAMLTNVQASKRLGISTQTVKNHWMQIYDRLGMIESAKSCRIRVLTWALRRGSLYLWDLPNR